jgi:BirA family biotin operon repressor/biotin-[acetyl-CoA-carboxylase] ligase
MPARVLIGRRERFERIGSTNDVVRDWLADGEPEVCVAVAGEQTAGRGRSGRTWTAPPGRALLVSLGFRPTYLGAASAWRLAATVSLAMAEAAEGVAGLAAGTIRLKWPNDLVVPAASDGEPRKLAGVLGETIGLGSAEPRAIVGIGTNVDWPATEFPPALAGAMTSLREVTGGRPVDADDLLERFLVTLDERHADLRDGAFEAAAWTDRQLTSGRLVHLEQPGGGVELVAATGVDAATGALLVEEPGGGPARAVLSGDVVHVRVAAQDGV